MTPSREPCLASATARARSPLRVEAALHPDDAAAALVEREGIAVFAKKGEDATLYQHINAGSRPSHIRGDGADV